MVQPLRMLEKFRQISKLYANKSKYSTATHFVPLYKVNGGCSRRCLEELNVVQQNLKRPFPLILHWHLNHHRPPCLFAIFPEITTSGEAPVQVSLHLA